MLHSLSFCFLGFLLCLLVIAWPRNLPISTQSQMCQMCVLCPYWHCCTFSAGDVGVMHSIHKLVNFKAYFLSSLQHGQSHNDSVHHHKLWNQWHSLAVIASYLENYFRSHGGIPCWIYSMQTLHSVLGPFLTVVFAPKF